MSRRTDRVAEAIKRITSEVIHKELKDPRIKGFITITKVVVTPDLRLAKIYYSVLEDGRMKLIAQGLNSAKNFIRRHIANDLKLRYTPDILFNIDESVMYRARIDKILDKIHKERKDESSRKNNKSI